MFPVELIRIPSMPGLDDVMNDLPRLASVALTVYCADLLLPVLDQLWPDPPKRDRKLILQAIDQARKVAKTDCSLKTLKGTAINATALTGRVQIHLLGLERDETPLSISLAGLDEPIVGQIRNIVDVAARAARSAVCSTAGEAQQECMDAISWTFEVAHEVHRPELVRQVEEAIATLEDLCESEPVSNSTRFWYANSKWCSRG